MAKKAKAKTGPADSASDASGDVSGNGGATATVAADPRSWLAADKGYSIALDDDKIIARNAKGATLSSVPPAIKETEIFQQLSSLRDWLEEHNAQCVASIELWMLRSLPVPRNVLAAVWQDPSWQRILKNTVVCSVKKGQLVQNEAGFLQEINETKGAGIIDLDGESQWLKADSIAIPHPILLQELNDFRQMTVELGLQQNLDQLFRQTWSPTKAQLESVSVDDFRNGKFAQLNHALGLCRRLGYRVSGGFACCPVWENGTQVEARYWIGAEYPEAETWTGDLMFTDAQEHTVATKDVGPVTFSEGMRMAAAIYAKRVVEKTEEQQP
ncbi:MAG: DUF4132 domain-containing protein [Planctomycetaceae bacterium]|nr:DUF4132 domain-containing protein [Planctomycetaceae bacterium]